MVVSVWVTAQLLYHGMLWQGMRHAVGVVEGPRLDYHVAFPVGKRCECE